MKNNVKIFLSLIVCLIAALVSCAPPVGVTPGPNTNAGIAKLAVDAGLSAVIAESANSSAKAVSNFSGSMTITNLDTSEVTNMNWYVAIDEDLFTANSLTTADLAPGNYEFALVVSRGDHQYAGTATKTLLDGENTVDLTLNPVIGDVSTTFTVTQVGLVLFELDAAKLSGIGDPKLSVKVDGNETPVILDINATSGRTGIYVNLPEGDHTLLATLLDGSIQKSRESSGSITIPFANDKTLALEPLHAETVINLSLAGSDATFNFTIPAVVAEEAGGVADLGGVLRLSGTYNNPGDANLTFVENNGTITASHTFSNFRYDTVDFTIIFSDKTDDVQIGTATASDVALNNGEVAVVTDITLNRRTLFPVEILAVVGVNVYDSNGTPQSGASIYVDGTLAGITGSGSFGTAGYFKLFVSEGTHSIMADIGEANATKSVTLSSFDITNIEFILDGPVTGLFPITTDIAAKDINFYGGAPELNGKSYARVNGSANVAAISGTTVEEVDFSVGGTVTYISNMIGDGSKIYYTGYDGSNTKLYIYDGTGVTEANSSVTFNSISKLYLYGSNLIMRENNSGFYKYDGTSVTEITAGGLSITCSDANLGAVELNGKLYFPGTTSAHSYNKIYEYDGTTATMVTQGSLDAQNCWNTFAGNGRIYFMVYSPTQGNAIYTYDGNGSDATVVSAGTSGFTGDFNSPILYNGKVYFKGRNSGGYGMYEIDGTEIKNVNAGSSDYSKEFSNPVTYDGKIFFGGNDGTIYKIYQFDGTEISNVNAGTSGYVSNFNNPIVFQDKIYFRGNNGSSYYTGYIYDGTEIKTLTGTEYVDGFEQPTIAGEQLLFKGNMFEDNSDPMMPMTYPTKLFIIQ